MNQEKIGKYISNKRKELKLTQEQLAEKLGVTDRSVSRWENGRSMPDLSILKLLCNELNINLEELLSGEDKKNGNDEIINYIKYQKKLYRYRMFIIIFILLLIIGSILYFAFRPYRLEFSDNIDYLKPIYNIDENVKLYSKFDNNYYIRNSKIELKDALKSGIISIEKIKSGMDYYSELNDGGTIIYQSKDKKYYLFSCNTISGNKNYYITGSGDDYSICSYEDKVKINHKCLMDILDNAIGYDTKIKFRDNYNALLITSGNIPSWDIYTGLRGTYAIIKTDDNVVIKDFKNWFNKKDSNYKFENIYENWYIFISNGNDIDIKILNDCIK